MNLTLRDLYRLILQLMGGGGILYVVRHWFKLYHKTGHIHFDNLWKLLAEVCLILIGIYLLIGAPLLLRLLVSGDKNDKDNDRDSDYRG